MFITVNDKNAVVELIEQVKLQYEKEKQILIDRADQGIAKYKELVKQPEKSKYSIGAGTLASYVQQWFKSKDYWGGDKELTSVEALEKRWLQVEEVVDQYISDCQKVYDENLDIIKFNQELVNKVTNIMVALGVPNTYSHSYYKSSNSRKPTVETKKAGYLEDLVKYVKTSQPSVPRKSDLIGDDYSGAKKYYNDLVKSIKQKEIQAQREKEKQENIHKLALLRAKYTPEDATSRQREILDGILKQDKYLRLAYYLEKNRGDWSDGYSYAETGLDGFTVETEQDSKIYNDINQYIEDWDGDGRVFRDCEWNYNVLYSLVENESLKKDLETLQSMDNG